MEVKAKFNKLDSKLGSMQKERNANKNLHFGVFFKQLLPFFR